MIVLSALALLAAYIAARYVANRRRDAVWSRVSARFSADARAIQRQPADVDNRWGY